MAVNANYVSRQDIHASISRWSVAASRHSQDMFCWLTVPLRFCIKRQAVMDEYQLIWQISADSQQFETGFLLRIIAGAIVTLLGAIGLGLKLFSRRLPDKWVFQAGFALIIGVVWTTFHWNIMSAEKAENTRLASLLSSQQHQTAEGVVKVLHQQPAQGHSQGDLIEINSKQFEINYYVIAPGYRQTIAHGGALSEGTFARVHYSGDTILSVEIRQN